MTPVRLQLSRRRGFRLQELSLATNGLPAVKVDRTTRWGNRFSVKCTNGRWRVIDGGLQYKDQYFSSREAAVERAVRAFESTLGPKNKLDIRNYLHGHNLACWCKPGAVCHADVLLAIANPKETP